MKAQVFERLDEIERLDPDPTMDTGALHLMESLVGASDVRDLVERYGGSHSLNIVRYLALLLARRAESPTHEAPTLVFHFIERLRLKDDPETLGSCLTAIYLQLGFDYVWVAGEKPVRILYPFLIQCLDHSGKQSVLVWYGVLQVLSRLYDKKTIEKVFEPAQVASLRKKVMQLSSLNNELLDSQLSNLTEFLT